MKLRFDSITPKLITQRKHVHELCRQFTRSPSKGNLKRLKGLFGECGEQVIIESGFHMDYGDNVFLGDRVYINTNCTIIDGIFSRVEEVDNNTQDPIKLDPAHSDSAVKPNLKSKANNSPKIIIKDDCLIGPNVQLLAVSHDVDPQLRKAHKYNYAESITLQKNVWLGAGVIVLAGVTIGENSVVGAGSLVTKNVAANSFYAGNPAVKIRDI